MFHPKDGIVLQFNFPVQETSLREKLTVTRDGQPQDIVLTAKDDAKTRFQITLKK